jgi:DNA repair protein SbcC/Rad50
VVENNNMINGIKMHNFISHTNTTLMLNKGITIFVGHNGSGKSSVIDAMTFALFGEHTRRSNKNLIRRGSSSSSVHLNFSIGSREYSAYRELGVSGQSIAAKFDLVSDAGNPIRRPIVFGERKQFGESMSVEAAKVLGMDYKKLKVAAIIQQGELIKIIESQPKEFKELLNSLIGIDRLDLAYQTMHDVIDGFRERLREQNGGFDDKQIESIRKTIEQKRVNLYDVKRLLTQLENQRNDIDRKMHFIEKEIERLEPLILQARELQVIENSLVNYVNKKRECIATDIVKFERITKEASDLIQIVSEKEAVRINLQMITSEAEDLQQRIINNEGEFGKLKGLLECSRRLEIRDGKCPICNSAVDTINKIFDINYIQSKMKMKMDERAMLFEERASLKKEESTLEEKERRIVAAEKFLTSNCIANHQDIIRLKEELLQKKNDLSKLPKTIVKVGEDAGHLGIDDFSKSLVVKINKLREQVKELKLQDYTDAKLKRTKLSNELIEITTKIGAAQRSIQEVTQTIDTSNRILIDLQHAAEYINKLDNIRSVVFNRDGHVGLSLRSWALKMISMKASDYAAMFNIGISRIELIEKARDVGAICYGRYGEIDMDSLSGGERVAVALALRLAIAYMMGSNKLDFIILDEPTAHLDEERRKSLLNIISEVFKNGIGPLSQILIITHDAEILEDSEVDRIYRFMMGADGSTVSSE